MELQGARLEYFGELSMHKVLRVVLAGVVGLGRRV